MNVNVFLNELASDDGRNYKIDLLNRHADNEVLREVVRLALDPMTQFYQRKIPAYTTGQVTMELEHGLNRLFPLASRMVTGNAAIAHLTETLSSLSDDNAQVIEKIIQKDLRCGVSVSTANKVWPNLVMDYPCMLCSQYEQKLVDKIKWPALVQLKMDGMRFNAIIRNGTVEYRSRNGKELNLLGNLDKDFIILSQGVECVFDGELIVSDKGIILDRQTGNGILNKASKGTISDLEAHKIRATVWDVIPYNDFISGVCKVPYSTRINSLELMLERKPEKVSMVQSNIVNTIDDANVLFETYLADGQEGIILKDLNGIWEDKRTKSQIKFKGELECDLKCVGIQAGTGKYEGMMGALLLESEDGTVKVSVGSGFNDDHRTNIGDEVIGKIIAVKYNARITNKQGEQSLFLPVFLEVREDKDTADLNKDIK
jgi:hypothetical protein